MQEWLNILIRIIVIFAGLLAIMRLIVRGNITKINPFKYVSLTVIAVMTALISLNIVKNGTLGALALITWILLDIGVDFLSLKSKGFHDFAFGKGIAVIKHGKIMEGNLFKQRMTGEELLSALRMRNAFNISDVEFAILEPTGDISVIFKPQGTLVELPEPQTVIMDGNIIDESLANMGLNRKWLKTEIEKMELSLDNIFIGQVDSHGNLYVDLFNDKIEPPRINVKQMLYATLEKCTADLTTFSLETQNEKASAMYKKNGEILERVLISLKPFLLQ